MRLSIFSLFLALAVAVAGPLAFAAETDVIEEQVSEQEQVPGPEALTEAQDTVIEETQTATQEKVLEMQEAIVEAEAATEDCANGADDDGDEKVDCDDSDCADDPGCKSGY